MVNYSNSKIYKLVNNNCSEGNCYYGSTAHPLHKRFYRHKIDYKQWKTGKYHYVFSFKLFEEDFENTKIILVEEFKCKNKQQLEARERFYIENNKCLNKCIPGRTKKEYYKANKEKIIKQIKKNYEKNADKRKEQMKEYYEANKDKIKKQKKEYYKANKDKIKKYRKEYQKLNANKHKEYMKNYYKANKEKMIKQIKKNKDKIKEQIKQKIKCPFCCSFVRKDSLKRHQRSIKCKKFQNNSI